jgi:hypothetical protein
MPQRNRKKRLLSALQRIAVQAHSKDTQILKEMEKCPSSKTACSILTGALHAHAGKHRDELLRPVAGWIHPLV